MKKKTLLIITLFISILSITGCKKKNMIVGTWVHDSYIYTFNKDNTCLYDAAGSKMECTYEIEENKLSILFENNNAPFMTTFKIEEDTLHIIDSFGSDIEYKKQ